MTVVSDASPLVSLAQIETLSVLPALYSSVVLPDAVFEEVVVAGQGQPGANAIREAAWVETRAVANRDLVRALRQDLDEGEAEAIALAVEMESVLLLMDEKHGRETADHFDLSYVGTIGLLVEAKRSGHIRAIRPYLDALQERAGFRISDRLYRRVLRDEGET